ncbi:MAG: PAN domain-containing protein [Xanthobacteraceae bacterium]
MRALVLGMAAFALVAAAHVLTAGSAAAQSGYDRPGGDFTNGPVPSGDPAVCAARCEREKNCRSWTFSYPSASGEPAMCWLKREVKRTIPSPCCVSGVRGAALIEPHIGGLEFSIERAGGDYRSFDIQPDPHGKACAAACQADNHCRAWTYRRPGYGSNTAHCFLKETIKPPNHRPCCISGVVR